MFVPLPSLCKAHVTVVAGPTNSGTGLDTSGFIPSLYDTLEAQLCIDVTREYNSGESNGGIMSYQTGVVLHARLVSMPASRYVFV